MVVCAFTELRWELLIEAVASLRRQTRPVEEVIVVIDHNASLSRRARARLPAVVVDSTEAPGLSGARNTGLAHATGDVVAFLDDDARAAPTWAAHLMSAYTGPDVLGVGGTAVASFADRRPDFFPEELDWVLGCSHRGLPVVRADVRNLLGANMSFRRSVFATVGGFTESLGRVGNRPLGCEETELCIRAARELTGGRIVLEPKALVHHHVPAERATWTYLLSRCFSEGLSKAAMTRIVGSQDGLRSERAYVLRTLPLGVARGLRDAALGGQTGALARVCAIAAGLLATVTGYVRGLLRTPLSARELVPAVVPPVPRHRLPWRGSRGVGPGRDPVDADVALR